MADTEKTQEAMDVKEAVEESTDANTEQPQESEDAVKTEEEQQETEETAKTEEELAAKTEEDLEQELKETQISIPRFAPHNIPNWDLSEMRGRWMWNIRIFPIDQEDCRNCLLDSATKIAQESWYYVPKRKNGQGSAEMSMVSASEAKQVMGRVLRMPFYHHYVTVEINKRSAPGDGNVYSEVVETATVVLDSTKCERIKNTAKSVGSFKRRNLWVRYLPENTSPDLLRVLFPLTQSTPEVQTHDDLRIGMVESNSKTDVLLFMKAYVTVVINGSHILALQNREPERETETKEELDKTVTSLDSLENAPVEAADRTETRKTDKAHTNRILKRTFQAQQQKNADNKRRDYGGAKRGRGEPPAKRGGGGQWNDRRSGGSAGGGGRYQDPAYAGSRAPRGGYGGAGYGMDTQGMAAEMMMMQAQLNQTIQNQLLMMNPRDDPMSQHYAGRREAYGYEGAYEGGYGGGYGGGHGGGRGGGKRGGGRGGGRKGYGGW